MFERLAVVDRGEPAVRITRAVRQVNEERDCDIVVIALHTRVEQRALFVRAADESVCLRDDGEGACRTWTKRSWNERCARVAPESSSPRTPRSCGPRAHDGLLASTVH